MYFQLDMFRAYTPIFRSNGCYNFFTYVAYGVLGLVWLGVGPEQCVCWWRVEHATSTHTPQDRHLTTRRTPYATYVNEIITSIAPEDGHVNPKHVELKELK